MPKKDKEASTANLAAFREEVAKAEIKLREAKANLAAAEKAAKGGK